MSAPVDGITAMQITCGIQLALGRVPMGAVLELSALRQPGRWAVAIHQRPDLLGPMEHTK